MAGPSVGATPATRALAALGIAHRPMPYSYDPNAEAVGIAAARALGYAPDLVFKTLVAELSDGRPVFAVIESDARLDLKALARAAGAKGAGMADPKTAERLTGYVVGGISPLGGKKQLPVFISAGARDHSEILVNGGRRGLLIAVAPTDLARACNGCFEVLTV